MKKTSQFFLAVLIISFVLPSVALASWWNPFTWKIFNKKVIPQEKVINVDTEVIKIDDLNIENSEIERPDTKDIPKRDDITVDKIEEAAKDAPVVIQKPTSTSSSLTISSTSVPVSTSTDEVKIYTVDEVRKMWEPYIVNLKCTLVKDGQTYYGKGGTGLVINHFKDGPSILLNRSKLQNNIKGVWTDIADYCDVTFPKDDYSLRIEKQNFRVDTGELTVQDSFLANSGDIDVAHLVISSKDQYIRNLLQDYSLKSCESIFKGDNLIIMGFPVNKSQNKVSYVTGLIDAVRSGYTGGDLIITTANAKEDYSGGPVVRIKDNCYLGIQTRNDSSSVLDLYFLFINGDLRYYSE
jgi:hypothetical protein